MTSYNRKVDPVLAILLCYVLLFHPPNPLKIRDPNRSVVIGALWDVPLGKQLGQHMGEDGRDGDGVLEEA